MSVDMQWAVSHSMSEQHGQFPSTKAGTDTGIAGPADPLVVCTTAIGRLFGL